MRARSDRLADLGEMEAHRFAADPGHDHGGADRPLGADRAKQPSGVVPIVALHCGAGAALRPHIAQSSLLADASFILKPNLERLVRRLRRQCLGYQFGEVFLNVACASRSRLGRIASPELLPGIDPLPHLICSRPAFDDGGVG